MDMQAPLADRMRPSSLSEFVGQEHLVGEGKILQTIIGQDIIPSMIFWGPPGSGKTTLARIIAKETSSEFVQISAVLSGVSDIREIVKRAKETRKMFGHKRTILFIDEIHRFNKAQQDSLLPHVEDGTLILIGATTENPSFEVIGALLSRTRVFVLTAIEPSDIAVIITSALKDTKRGLGKQRIKITNDQIIKIAEFSNGDARTALNLLETVVQIAPVRKARRVTKTLKRVQGDEVFITDEILREAMQKSTLLYDKAGEEHYNTISAFIKSMRASDPDAAVYYLARMVEAGEDPLFIARRMVNFASEDVRKFGNLPVPLNLRNPVTKLMKGLGYGKGYEKYTKESLLPDKLRGRKYYRG